MTHTIQDFIFYLEDKLDEIDFQAKSYDDSSPIYTTEDIKLFVNNMYKKFLKED